MCDGRKTMLSFWLGAVTCGLLAGCGGERESTTDRTETRADQTGRSGDQSGVASLADLSFVLPDRPPQGYVALL